MTRDHRYMTRVLDSILVAWTHAPELRLGQLLENAGGRNSSSPMFYIEDSTLVDAVQKFDQEFLCGPASSRSSGNSSGT